MLYGDGVTRNLDGSFIEVPTIPDLPVESNWRRPESVNDLIDRVHPIEQGHPLAEEWTRARAEKIETWRHFFSGEEIVEEERQKLLAELRQWSDAIPTYQTPASTWRKELARIKFQVEKESKAHTWLDNDPRAVLAAKAQDVGLALAAKSGLEFKLKTLTEEIERNAGEINAEKNQQRDFRLLWTLADTIVKAPASFSDQFAYLLPASTIDRIERNRQWIRRDAERVEEERSAQRLKQIEESDRRKLEELAGVESATFDDLLDTLFPSDGGASILEAFRRKTWPTTHLDVLLRLRDSAYPVRRRGYERLVELGASVGIIIPSLGEVEAAQVAKTQAEDAARQKELSARINALDSAPYAALCEEVNRLNLAPPEIIGMLPGVRDINRVTQIQQYFIDRAGAETDPLRKRVCQVMAQKVFERNHRPGGGAWQGLG